MDDPESRHDGAAPVNIKARKVLIVEDDPIVTQVLSDILDALGYEALAAENGTQALSIFEDLNRDIGLVILDYGLPGIHPTRLLETLREINPRIKVIVSSGYSRNAVGEDFPIETIDAFIGKPYDPESLIAQVEKVTRR